MAGICDAHAGEEKCLQNLGEGEPWSPILLCDDGKVTFPVPFIKNEKSCA